MASTATDFDREVLEEAQEYHDHFVDQGLEGQDLIDAVQAEAEKARQWGREDLADALDHVIRMDDDGQMERVFVTSKGDEVVTTLSDEEAIEILKGMANWNDFAASLYGQWVEGEQKGREPRDRLSPKQWPWAHKLAVDQMERQEKRQQEQVKYTGIHDLFQHALDNGHKTPRITLDMDEGTVRLSVAGSNSRTPGAIHVTDGRPFGENTYYGRIDTDGIFRPRNTPSWVTETLEKLDGETLDFVVQYGQKTENCCFCNTELVTTESVTAGYGPICGPRYGLPWPV